MKKIKYNKRKKLNELDYDIFIAEDIDGVSTKSFISSLKEKYDVIFCCPRSNVPPFKDEYYLLPKLKEKYSTGYDVSVRSTYILDNVKRVPLGIKYFIPNNLSIEGKQRSSTFSKKGIMLTNSVMELDSSYRNECLVEVIPLKYLLNKTTENIPVISSFDYEKPYERLDYFQFKFIPVITHTISQNDKYNNLNIVGIVCDYIFNNFDKLFSTDRKGGFGSTDF